MGKWIFPLVILGMGALLSAFTSQTVPAAPTAAIPASNVGPSPTVTARPSTINGEFALTNTSAPGMEVGVETMAILLEYRLSPAGPWEKAEVECSFDPPAPAVLREELVDLYECTIESQLPGNIDLRTTVEVKIFGSEEIFRQEVIPP